MALWHSVLLWNFPAQEWWQGSWLSRLSGVGVSWGTSSWLMRWLDPLSLVLACLYFVMASQASTAPLGLILLAMAGVWVGQSLLFSLPTRIAPTHALVALFWGVATMATLLSPVRHAATEGWTKLTLYLVGYFLLHRLLQKPLYRHILVAVVLGVSLILGVYGLRQYLYGAEELATWVDPESGLSGVTRVYSYLLNPNLYGGFLVPVIPLGLGAAWVWPGWGTKLWALGITAINLMCLALSYCRGGWIGELAALGLMAVFLVQWNQIWFPARWRPWILPILLGGSALVLVLAVLAVEPLRLRVLSIFAGRNDTSNNFRLNVWTSAVQMIQDFPWHGIGPGNDAFNRVYPLYSDPSYTALGAYSVPLEIALETGIPGALIYLWMLVVTLAQGWGGWLQKLTLRDGNALWMAAGMAGALGMVVHGLVDTVWYRPQLQMLWWLCLALITSQLVPAPEHPSEISISKPESNPDPEGVSGEQA